MITIESQICKGRASHIVTWMNQSSSYVLALFPGFLPGFSQLVPVRKPGNKAISIGMYYLWFAPSLPQSYPSPTETPHETLLAKLQKTGTSKTMAAASSTHLHTSLLSCPPAAKRSVDEASKLRDVVFKPKDVVGSLKYKYFVISNWHTHTHTHTPHTHTTHHTTHTHTHTHTTHIHTHTHTPHTGG